MTVRRVSLPAGRRSALLTHVDVGTWDSLPRGPDLVCTHWTGAKRSGPRRRAPSQGKNAASQRASPGRRRNSAISRASEAGTHRALSRASSAGGSPPPPSPALFFFASVLSVLAEDDADASRCWQPTDRAA